MLDRSVLYRHRFGANYVPSRGWYYSWNDFDAETVRRDFEGIASLGLDHIRLMTIWPFFQPNPLAVESAHLDRLGTVMEVAHSFGLDVVVTAFTGWLSGYAFTPPYVPRETFYTSTQTREAQFLYLKALSEVVADRPNFLGFDLGNELNCCWQASEPIGDAWMRDVLARCREVAPRGVHVNGVDHQPWFHPATFSPEELCQSQEIVPLHCWILFTGAMSYGPYDSPACTRLGARMARLARSIAADPVKPIWIQEFGASAEWLPNEAIPAFLRSTVESALEEGVSWFTWWCSHDIDRRYKFDDLEYDLGLFTRDNQPKAHALEFAALAREHSGKVASPAQTTPEAPPERTDAATWEWLLRN
jgi:endo-1,4-beta-mannosidase